MSLLTQWQSVENKITIANSYSNAILTHGDPFIPLQYIQSSGTQYLMTDVTMSTNLTIEIQYQLNAVTTNQCVLGESSTSGWYYYGAGLGGTSSYAGIAYNATNILRKSVASTSVATTTLTNTTWKYNSNTYSGSSLLRNAGTKLCILYCGKYSSQRAKTKIYYVKIYQNGTLIRDLIPVKNANTDEVCMYDTITSTYYTNQGTGTFTAGPVKS